MKKRDLILLTAQLCGHPKNVVHEVLDAAGAATHCAVSRGEDVFLLGLGKLELVPRGEKLARNPHTGVEMILPPANMVKLRPSCSLVAAANGRLAS
jgi:DNA-binding protein HU-beta